MPKKILESTPLETAQVPEIGRWLWALAEARKRTMMIVEDCDQRTLDWSGPDGLENSMGTLLYHIAIVEMAWLYMDVLGEEFPAEVKELVPLPMADEHRKPYPLKEVSLAEHVARLNATRKITNAKFGEMDLEEWRRARVPVDETQYEVTPEWAVFHLIEHEAGHAAQMSSLKARARRHFEAAAP